jgi:hypothetical protein
MKYLIGALVVANLLCLAWFNGWMAPLGGDPREPDRMATQIEPQRLRIVPPSRLPADTLPVPSSPSSSSEPPSASSVPAPEPAPRSAR